MKPSEIRPVELIDSHCHIDFPDLAERTPELLARMQERGVIGAVCVAVRFEDLDGVLALADRHPSIWATVGVHPDYEACFEPAIDDLVRRAEHPKVLAIGETGLDYYRIEGDRGWQQERFRKHIRAAIGANKPLVVHTREAAADTLRILREENASAVGGIMHCFTESIAVAEAAVELGFYISFSGILSFKSAASLRQVAAALPLERLLVETDAPYLAPAPYRGKTNEPAFVLHVAEALAKARGASIEEIAAATTANFRRLFPRTL